MVADAEQIRVIFIENNILKQKSAQRQLNRLQIRMCVKKEYRLQSKKIRNDQEMIQSDPRSCPQNQKGSKLCDIVYYKTLRRFSERVVYGF